jgi:hypothetical protein
VPNAVRRNSELSAAIGDKFALTRIGETGPAVIPTPAPTGD